MIKKVFYNTAAQVLGKAITASSTLVITVIIGKSLGPAGYGDFTKIFVFVGYFYTFADFGLNTIYIKFQNAASGAFINYLVAIRLILGLSLAAAAILISQLLPYDPLTGVGFSPLVKIGIIIASVTIITQALFTSANAFFQWKLRYDLSAVAAVCGTLLVLTATIVATVYQAPLNLYVAAYVLGGITYVVAAYLLIKKVFKASIWPSFSYRKFKDFLGQSWPVGAALIFNLIYFRLDVIILSYTRTSQEVGIYGLAYQFFEASLAIPIFFANALFPLLTALHKENYSQFKKEIKRWLAILAICAIALMSLLILVSYSIPVVFDNRFLGSQSALIILSLGLPFFFISALLWHVVIIENKQKFLMGAYLAGALFNLLFNLILIPKYGPNGASTVTVVSEAFVTLLLLLLIKAKQKDSGKAAQNFLK